MPNQPLLNQVAVVAVATRGRRPDWGSFFPRKVQELVERETPPGEWDISVVRTRLYQVERDPSAADEAERLRAYLDRHR